MRPLGITASQYTLLAQLASRDGITAVEIGHELDIENRRLSRNLKRLLVLGLIVMDPPAGRRGRGLHLTPKGQGVLKEAFPVWMARRRGPGRRWAATRATLDGLAAHGREADRRLRPGATLFARFLLLPLPLKAPVRGRLFFGLRDPMVRDMRSCPYSRRPSAWLPDCGGHRIRSRPPRAARAASSPGWSRRCRGLRTCSSAAS